MKTEPTLNNSAKNGTQWNTGVTPTVPGTDKKDGFQNTPGMPEASKPPMTPEALKAHEAAKVEKKDPILPMKSSGAV